MSSSIAEWYSSAGVPSRPCRSRNRYITPNDGGNQAPSRRGLLGGIRTAAPRILGALLDGLSGALRSYRSIKIQRSSRMIDFVKWAEAGWQALGVQPGTLESAYIANRSSAIEDAIDADLVATAIVDLVNKQGQFQGTATKLLSELEQYVLLTHRNRNWPKDATRLSGHLRRAAPLLRPRGIEITGHRTPDAARNRMIEIKRRGTK